MLNFRPTKNYKMDRMTKIALGSEYLDDPNRRSFYKNMFIQADLAAEHAKETAKKELYKKEAKN